MKKLLLLILVLSLCSFVEGQSQSQTPSRKRLKLSPNSKRAQFAKPPHFRFKEMEGDSSLLDERLRNLLPPYLQNMDELPPHNIIAERRWLWESDNERSGMAPNDPLDRLYPPHKRPLAQMPTPLKIGAPQILSGGAQEAWVARHDEQPGSSYDYATAMAVDAAGNIYVTGYSQSFGSSRDYLTVKYDRAGVQQWTARYNGSADGDDYPVALAIDGAGNVYVTGYSEKGRTYHYPADYATVKYNSAGTQEWVATYNGPRNGYEKAVAIAVDGAGNVYVTGYSTDLYGAWRTSDYATVKYNPAGTQEWVATYIGPGNGADFARALGVDSAGNVYVTGTSHGSSDINSDYVTVKYNSAGQQQWVARYNGHRNDEVFALALDNHDNVYVTGYSGTIKYNSVGIQKWVANWPGTALAVDGAGNIFVTGTGGTIKYNANGTQEWARTYNGPEWYHRAVALVVDGANNVYVTGYGVDYFSGNYLSGLYDYITVKYDSAGTQEWVNTYSGPGNRDDRAVALGVDAAGNVYVTGYSDGSGTSLDYATVKYDAFGVEQWVARHDEPSQAGDYARSMVVDDAGNIYVTGTTFSSFTADYITVKYDATGTQQWVARFNGPGDGNDEANALAVDGAGNVYVTGRSYGGSDSQDEYATIKYDSAGRQQWVARYNRGYYDDVARAIAVDGNGDVYVTGTVDIDEGDHRDPDWATVKYNANGQQQWVTYYGGVTDGNDGEAPRAIAIDTNGNVYVTGVRVDLTDEEKTNADYATVKYNAAGQMQWVVRYGGDSNELATALAVDDASNVYVTGYSAKAFYGTSSDYVTIKYNLAGIQEWVATYNGSENGRDYPVALDIDAAGNVYVTGSSGTIKYNSAGTQEWVANWPGTALVVDGAGNVYVTGTSANGTSSDYATVKYNTAGTQVWMATYNGPGNGDDQAVAIAVDGKSNVYVAGTSLGSGTGYDFATIKYPSDPIVVNSGSDTTICAGGSVQIGGSPTGSGGHGGPYSFSWTPTTGLNDPTAPNPKASPATTITYTVTVTETANGLSARDDVTVTVRPTGWSVAHIVDVDDIVKGIDQGATIPPTGAPRNNRGLALSPDERFLYLGYNTPADKRLVRKIDLSVADPAQNRSAVVAQLILPKNTETIRDIATDDKGRVYLALGTRIEVYNPALQVPPLYTISGFAVCVGVATRRENGKLVVYASDRVDRTLERIELVEGADETIVSSSRAGLDGDGEAPIIGARSPRGLDIASDGTAWITDLDSGRVYRVNSAGQTVDSTGVKQAMDIAIDETRGEAYVSQYSVHTIKVLSLSTGIILRTLIPPATDLNVDLDGEFGLGAFSGIAVASCKRVFVANENGRSLLTGNPPDSPFSNIGDNNDVKAADTDPVLMLTGSGVQDSPPAADAGPDKTICAGGSVQIGGNPTCIGVYSGPYSFSWTPTTGLNDPTAPNPLASPATTTTYTVTVTELTNGLSATDDVTVIVPATGWSVAHIVDVDDIVKGMYQGVTTPPNSAPRNNRGLALSPDERFLYLGYNTPADERVVRKIDLSVSDPAQNQSAVVAQLILPKGTETIRDITTDDKGRVYLALGAKIVVYNANLLASPLYTISRFAVCVGVATRRENGKLVVYASDRVDRTLERFELVEGAGKTIISSSRAGLDGDGEAPIIGARSPRGLDIASDGTAWIADLGSGRVYRVNSAGQTVDSTGVKQAMDIAIDETRGEAYVSQYSIHTIKVLSLSTGMIKRTLIPPATDLNVDLDGEDGSGVLSGIGVASCRRVFVANENGRSTLTGNPLNSPFSNTGDDTDVKAADTDPVLVLTGSGVQNSPPAADAGPDKTICAGGSVEIGGNPTGIGVYGGPYSFGWTPTTGLNDPTAPNPLASPATTTTYTITVIEPATGLSATDDVTVTIPATGWSVAHIVDVDDIVKGINQGAAFGEAPRNNRGLALSPDKRFLYLGYDTPASKPLVRKIDLDVTDPAQNQRAVVAQLILPKDTETIKDIATDDRGRVYLALGARIEVYNAALQAPLLHTISGFAVCVGVATRRENGKLVVYASDRVDRTLERFELAEGDGETITSSSRAGLDGDGEAPIIGARSPRGLDIASDGTAWITDLGSGRVYLVNSAGQTVDSTGVKRAVDIAIDETRGEAYVSQYSLHAIKVLSLSTGEIKRTLTPPAADLNVDLDGEDGSGLLSGIDVGSCKRVFVANENGRSILTSSGDSPFSNVGDNNVVKAADTDPVLVVTGSGLAKESEEEVAVAEAAAVTSYELAQNYPNPFSPFMRGIFDNASTTISFALPEAAEVSLKIYDVAGQLVQTLVNGVIEAGRHQVVWDGTNQHGMLVASGVYFYQLRAGEFKQVRKMSLVR